MKHLVVKMCISDINLKGCDFYHQEIVLIYKVINNNPFVNLAYC